MRRAKETSPLLPAETEESPTIVTTAPTGNLKALLAWIRTNPHASSEDVDAKVAEFDDTTKQGLRRLTADAAARCDIHHYASSVFRDQDGDYIQTRDLDRAIQRHFDQCRDDGVYCGILAPVGSGKSVGISLIRATWEVCKDPNRLIKIVTATDDESVKRVVSIGRLIMHNPDFKRIFGHLITPAIVRSRSEEEWSKHKLHVQRTSGSVEPTFEGYGVTASAQGSRAHLLIFDDCVDYRIAIESPALLRMVIDKLQNQWLSRLVLHDHHVVWIATRWTDEDPSTVFMKNTRWRFLEISVAESMEHFDARVLVGGEEIDRYTIPLIPQWSPAVLRTIRDAMTEIAYNRAYRQLPWSKDDRWFGSFDDCVREDVSMEQLAKQARDGHWYVVVGVDIGTKKRPGNAIVTVAVAPDSRRHVIDARVGSWKSPEFAWQIHDVDQRYSPSIIVVEDNSTQEMFLDWASDPRTGYPFRHKLLPFTTTGQSKQDPLYGLRSLDVEFSRGAWTFPAAHVKQHEESQGSAHIPRCGPCRLLNEVRWHPMSETSDLLMSLWFARSAVLEFGGAQGAPSKELLELPEDPFFLSRITDVGGLAGPDDDEDDDSGNIRFLG